MNERLRTIIAEAYVLFAVHRFGGHLTNVCTACCVTAGEQVRLICTPREHIPAELMHSYYGAAFGGCPDWEETEHFLPRLFELSAEGYELGTGGFESNFRHLGQRGVNYRHNWDRKKVDLIDRYFLALAQQFWQASLGDPTWPHLEVEVVLCAIARGGACLETILSEWQTDSSRQATIQLATMISNLHWAKRQAGVFKLGNAFWDDIADHERQCVTWLLSPEHYLRFDSAMTLEEDEEIFSLLSLARDFASSSAR